MFRGTKQGLCMKIEKKDKILVTGGTGFLGKAVRQELLFKGYKSVYPIGSSFDLTEQFRCRGVYDMFNPSVVIHLAAKVGGIGANKENPGKFIHDNLAMGVNIIEQGRAKGIKKFVMVGTVCSYPKFTPVPFREEEMWNGYPEETNAPYGIAKKTLMQMVISYKEQYGFNGINLIPVNMYGPYDNFDPSISHVIPALILKFDEAIKNDENEVTVWGTGSASREFLYVEDCAEAIVMAMENHNDPHPVNIGTGKEISIKNLVELIAEQMNYGGKIIWDKSKPDGQPRRCLDTTKAESFGFEAETSLKEGLQETIEWFNDNRNSLF